MLSNLAKSLTPSPTVSLDSRVKDMQAEGIKIINLGIGEPDFDTPSHIQQFCSKAMADGFTHYSPAAGMIEFRKAIIDKFRTDNSINYELPEVMVGLGSKPILYLAYLSLLNKGDEVIIPVPTWNTFAEQVKLCGGKPVLLRMKPPFKLTANDVKNKITKKTKILLLNSPSNPTGAMIEAQELEKIAKLAIKHDFYIISDEIYEKLIYKGNHISIASINDKIKQKTITINGLSKAYAMTGWRIGFAGGPKDIIQSMVNFQSQIASSAITFGQVAGVKALRGTQIPLIKMHEEFIKRRQYILINLKRLKKISFSEPEGAFYVFVNIDKLLGGEYKTSSAWCEGLLEKEKVAIVPGEGFFYPGYFRLSYASSLRDLKAGLEKIEKFISQRL